MRRNAVVLFAAAVFSLPLSSQGIPLAIELSSGEVWIGRIVQVGDSDLTIEVGYPEAKTQKLARSELTARSWYDVLAARVDANDPQAQVRLAAAALELGLPAHAIAGYRIAAQLDPALHQKAEQEVRRIREQVAEELLAEGRAALLEHRSSSARLLAQTILDRYGDTRAAKAAPTVIAEAAAKSPGGAREVSAQELDAALRQAVRHLQAADQAGPKEASHGKIKAQRQLEASLQHLEGAWKSIAGLAGPASETALGDRLATLREDLRRRMVAGYLDLGAIYLQRRAFPDAKRYCEKACDLDPEGKSSHRLHELILLGEMTSGWR